jgi:hypothetical protein
MKLSAVICSRNDNYGGNLIERSTFCLNSMVDTFDEVWYIDWNSDTQSLLYEIWPNLTKIGKINHIVIPPETVEIMTMYDPNAQKCCEVLARNIGLRRATGDWIISTNIDIIAPKREILEERITQLDAKTFYTVSRRSVYVEQIIPLGYQNIQTVRDFLYKTITDERRIFERVQQGDDYSIINCCGDFQMAHKNVWHEIRGFEQHLIYPLFADTNIQKKAVMHEFGLHALFDIPFFHIHHPVNAGGYGTVNKKGNDANIAIRNAGKTINPDTWGFSDVEIEYEVV